MAKQARREVLRNAKEKLPRSGSEIDVMMERAVTALTKGEYFVAEQLCDLSLHGARQLNDFDRMSRIALPLQEARRQRRLLAVECGKVFLCNEQSMPGRDPEVPIGAGCYVILPPCAGADARQIERVAFAQQVPVIAFGREPITSMGLLPIVIVGTMTIRVKVQPPADMDPEWCLGVIEQFAAQGMSELDTTRATIRQLDDALALLNTVRLSEDLHQKVSKLAAKAAREGK